MQLSLILAKIFSVSNIYYFLVYYQLSNLENFFSMQFVAAEESREDMELSPTQTGVIGRRVVLQLTMYWARIT